MPATSFYFLRFLYFIFSFQNLLSLVRECKAWVKLTGPYRISQHSAPPYADVQPFADALLRANPARLYGF